MTWPAPNLPVNFTNTTAQQDNHPGAHNDTNQSLNDNYRPQITTNRNDIADTRSVYSGTDPNGIATINSNSVRFRTAASVNRYDVGAGNFRGRFPYSNLDGGVFTDSSTATGFTTGSTPVAAFTTEVPTINNEGWPNGGFIVLTATALFTLDTAAADAALRGGIGIDTPNLAYPTTNGGTRARVNADQPRVGLSHTWSWEIPANTDRVWVGPGIANIQGSVLAFQQGAVVVNSFAF
jgi:hypothetical protein